MTKNLQQLLDEGVDGRHVLVRSDFNVPLDDNGNITDAGRIDASLPTLKALLDGGAKVIVMAHLGRPKGEVNPKFSLAPVAEALSERLGQFVPLAGDVSGEDAHERDQRAGCERHRAPALQHGGGEHDQQREADQAPHLPVVDAADHERAEHDPDRDPGEQPQQPPPVRVPAVEQHRQHVAHEQQREQRPRRGAGRQR